MVNRWVVLACFTAILLAHRSPLFGQARDTASLFGTVTDTQSAVSAGRLPIFAKDRSNVNVGINPAGQNG